MHCLKLFGQFSLATCNTVLHIEQVECAVLIMSESAGVTLSRYPRQMETAKALLKSVWRSTEAIVRNKTKIELAVLEATNDAAWGPTGYQMNGATSSSWRSSQGPCPDTVCQTAAVHAQCTAHIAPCAAACCWCLLVSMPLGAPSSRCRDCGGQLRCREVSASLGRHSAAV
jgi:hypothetical protein